VTPPAATAAGRAIPRTGAPRAPRRVSGPARPGSRGAAPPRRRPADPLAVRLLRRGRLLADSRLLDRLVAGRLWIPLVCAGLMGIVFMQVSMLKLNAGIGRAVQTASSLERQNAGMRADVSRMESGDRIAQVAHGLGMVVPADGGEHYVTAGAAGLAARAAQRMTSPDSTAVQRTIAGLQASGTAQATGAPTGTTSTATTAATPTSTSSAASTSTAAAGTTAAAAAPSATGASQAPAAQQQQAASTAPPGTTGATAAPAQQQQQYPATATTATTSGGTAAPASTPGA
jgi:hypothetical protein